MTVQQVVFAPNLYLDGLALSNDATTPNTKIDVAAGAARDSLNQADLILSDAVVINAGTVGINGLDVGTLAATKMYYIYLVSDPQGFNQPGCLLSLAVPSVGPAMPQGYGLVRYIGCWPTDSSSHFLKGYYAGKSFYYDASRATGITVGASATYALVDLTNLVPFVNNTPVLIQSNFAANAAGNTMNLQPQSATGDAVLHIAQAAGGTAHLVTIDKLLAQVVTTTVGINYKVSAGTLAVNVNGFDVIL